MNNRPISWPETPLRDVAFFQEGPGLRTYQWRDGGMKVINVTNIIGDGSVDTTNTDKYISIDEFETKYPHFAVEEGDIVVASSGNTYGKVGRIRVENLPLSLLGARGGTGKGLACCDIASRVTKGSNWPESRERAISSKSCHLPSSRCLANQSPALSLSFDFLSYKRSGWTFASGTDQSIPQYAPLGSLGRRLTGVKSKSSAWLDKLYLA
jgi:hypothetical protein